MQTQLLYLLKTRRFFPLFLTQFLSAFNDNVFKNAIVILITYRLAETSGINAQVLITFAAGIFILPFFLFSAMAGQLADKFDKARLIRILKFAEIGLAITACLGFYTQSSSTLLSVLFFMGTQAAFFGPLKYAILPDHLKEDELIAGNGLIEAGTFLSILLGTFLGGVFILKSGGILFISAIVLLLAVSSFISSLSIPKAQLFNPQLKINYNFLSETLRVMRYAKQQGQLFLAILGISWFWLIGSIFLSEMPAFTKFELHSNALVVTYFIALFSIGIGIGSLLCNRLLKGRVHTTYVPLGAIGITFFTIDLYIATGHAHLPPMNTLLTLSQFLSSKNGWHISLDLLMTAICGGLYTVPLYALLQQRSDPAHRARMIASNNIMNALFMVLASIVTLFMLEISLSVSQIFLITALMNAAVAIYICKLLPDKLVRAFFHWLVQTIYRVNVVGLENYYKAGNRLVIVANHTSFLDPLLLAIYLPDKLTFAIDTYTAKKWWIQFFLRLVDTYPVDPSNPMAIKSLIDLVKQDKRCVIFPEGRLTMTGALMKVHEGPGLIADKAQAKLLPVRIDGAQYSHFSRLKGKVNIRWAPKITLTIFPAQTLGTAEEQNGRARRQHISGKLYDLMTDVMFQSSNYCQTLFSSLLDAKSTHGGGHHIAEDIERNPITYRQFILRSFLLGSIFTKETKPGETVGILLPNMVSTAISFFALQAYCRIPAMLNYSAGAKNVVLACQTANIKIIYTSLKFVQVANLTDMISALEKADIKIIYLENLRKEIGLFNKLGGLLMSLFPRISYSLLNYSESKQALLNPDAAAVVLFTSGSEGTPKGVVLSHKNIQANCSQLNACIDFTASDKILNALPIFHSFGLTGGMLLPILSGVKFFLYPSPLHYRIVPVVAYEINATILFGTDTFLTGYAKHAHPYDFYSVRYVFAGAEKLREETRATWMQKFGIRIFEGYGTTETSPVLATNTAMQAKPGSVGRLLPGINYRLKPIAGIDEGGELVVSGPNIMKGYLFADNPGVLVPPADGWYETGDIVSVDESGYVTIQGRVKRFAKIAGEMVSLVMVEQQVSLLWPNHQHAVLNLPDAKKGEQLILVTTYAQAARDALVSHAKTNQLAEISIPKKIVILKELPLLGSGKVDYAAIRSELVGEGEVTEETNAA